MVQPPSGFPELLPAEQIVYQKFLDTVREVYELFGFAQIQTPAVERVGILTAKGGDEKEIYTLSRLAAGPGEKSQTDMALHFDLTVPLARYVSQHKEKLTFPFRRFQIQSVWRGERAQADRYREFVQCDIDVIGRGSLDIMTDAEMPSVIYHIFRKLDIGPFVIRINNRRLLQGFFEHNGICASDIANALRIIDKLEKIGTDSVVSELSMQLGIKEDEARAMIDFLSTQRTTDETLDFLRSQQMGETFAEGVAELAAVVEGIRSFGVEDAYFCLDLTIARGLGYYTGTVYETQLVDFPQVGSICSGGRYDNLTSAFSDEKMPGVGISIGVTRLVLKLIKEGVLKPDRATPADVLVTMMDARYRMKYLRVAEQLRSAGVNTEVYLESKRLGNQLKYANRKSVPIVLIAGEDEIAKGVFQAKDMRTGKAIDVATKDIVATIQGMLK